MKKILLILTLLITFGQISFAQCSADFTSYHSGNGQFQFYVNDSIFNTTYVWDLGDGTTTTTTDGYTSHIYSVAGSYLACLSIDDGAGCIDTFCDSVYYAGPSSANCDASFYYYADSNMSVDFYADDTSSNYTYVWNMGDGNSVTSTNGYANYIYSVAGTYAACLTIDDGAGCTDTFCDSIVVFDGSVTTNDPCEAYFYWYQPQDSTTGTWSNDIYAWNASSSSTGANITSYYWDFGNGTTSTLAYPSASFGNAGDYVICLTITDDLGCSSTHCDTISILSKASGWTLNVLPEGATVNLEEVEVVEVGNLYPNPVQNNATLKLNAKDNAQVNIAIVDLTGKVVMTRNETLVSGSNELTLNLNQLTNGMYFVKVYNQEFSSEVRFIKQ